MKLISQIFAVSIDDLLDDSSEIEVKSSDKTIHNHDHSRYEDFRYNIELSGWNDGVNDVSIIGEDKDFIFYLKNQKKKSIHGLIGKKYITSIDRAKNNENLIDYIEFEGRNYFCRKHVFIEFGKEGIIKGFFDFRDDDYRDVVVNFFTASNVCLDLGKKIDIDTISKLEEI